MSGTLIFPTPRRVRQQPIVTKHCELCATVFGKATCQRGMYSHLHFLSDASPTGICVYIASAHFEGATLYSFSVLAQLDSTMYEHPAQVARQTLEHLDVNIKGTPF